VTSGALRVALLHPCYFPEVRRGSERIIRELGSELAARGHDVTLITSHPERPSRTVEDGMTVVRHWRPPAGPLERRGFQPYLTHMPLAAASLRRGRFDLAHAFYVTDAVVAARWSARTGRPAVFSYMGVPDRHVLANKRRRLQLVREATRGASAVVALSTAAAEACRRWLGVDAVPIYPGFDVERFAAAATVPRSRSPTIFCAAAPDDPRKRLDLLSEAFARLRRTRADLRLVALRPREPDNVARYGLDRDGVDLVDPVSDPVELAPRYGAATVSALTSRAEAFGMVVPESLACGTPVVATRDGALPEIIDRPGVGELFDGDDAADVAAAIDRAIDSGDPDTCRARAADFSIARSADAHEELYRRLLR
jgi:glycosyltransferase involved in cell wall biosynthesis